MLDGHVFAVGGWEGSSRLDSVERYDPETNTWSPVASLKMAVTSPAVVAHEGKVKVAFYQKILMHTCHILNIPVQRLRPLGYLTFQIDLWRFDEILFRCLIFNCYNISICKKEKLKDETSKKNCETNGSQ